MNHNRRNIHQVETSGISTISIPTIIINGKDYSLNQGVNKKMSLPSGYNSDIMNTSFPRVTQSNNSQQRREIFGQQLNQMENKKTMENLFKENNDPKPSNSSLQNLYFNKLSNLNEIKDDFVKTCSNKNGVLNSSCKSDNIITSKKIGNNNELICCKRPELPNAGLFAENSENNTTLSNYNFGSSQMNDNKLQGSRQNITGGQTPERNATNELDFQEQTNQTQEENNNGTLNLKCNGIIPRWFQEFDDYCANTNNPEYKKYCSEKSINFCNSSCKLLPKTDFDYKSDADVKKYEDIKKGKINMEYKYMGITEDGTLPEPCRGCRSYFFLNKKEMEDPSELAYELGLKKKYNETNNNSTEINEELKKCQEDYFKKFRNDPSFDIQNAEKECLEKYGGQQPQNTSEAWKSFCANNQGSSCCLDKDYKDYETF